LVPVVPPQERRRRVRVAGRRSPDATAPAGSTPPHAGNLVAEAQSLFGVRHYRSYRFLLSLSDQIPTAGLEHHECSDNRLPELFFSDKNARLVYSWLMPHEYVHSWCGKYR
jgi:predicted metalloprotease with PDZ domain